MRSLGFPEQVTVPTYRHLLSHQTAYSRRYHHRAFRRLNGLQPSGWDDAVRIAVDALQKPGSVVNRVNEAVRIPVQMSLFALDFTKMLDRIGRSLRRSGALRRELFIDAQKIRLSCHDAFLRSDFGVLLRRVSVMLWRRLFLCHWFPPFVRWSCIRLSPPVV